MARLVGPATTSIQLISRTATASTWEVLGTATYSEEGTYTVSVSVSDVDGSSTSTSNTTFSITDAALSDTTSVQTFNATEGNSTGQQVLATFSDANPSAPLSDYTATVNWGGTLVGSATTSIQLISRTATASTWEVLGTATYSEEGTYTVSVSVSDVDASHTSTSNTTFSVTDATLSDTTSVQTFNATEGNSTGQQVLATFSDANPSAPLSDYTATVNWGGTLVGPATTSIQLISRTATASTWEVLGTATYSEEGTYTVSVSVSDVDGSHTSTSNTTFSVTDATLERYDLRANVQCDGRQQHGSTSIGHIQRRQPVGPVVGLHGHGQLGRHAGRSRHHVNPTDLPDSDRLDLGSVGHGHLLGGRHLYGQRLGERRRRQPAPAPATPPSA